MIARSVQNPRHVVCKRVLGLAGDRVTIPSSQRWGLGRTVKVGGRARRGVQGVERAGCGALVQATSYAKLWGLPQLCKGRCHWLFMESKGWASVWV